MSNNLFRWILNRKATKILTLWFRTYNHIRYYDVLFIFNGTLDLVIIRHYECFLS